MGVLQVLAAKERNILYLYRGPECLNQSDDLFVGFYYLRYFF